MSKKLCCVDGCTRSVFVLSVRLCNAHYQRLRRYGQSFSRAPVIPRGRTVADRFWDKIEKRGFNSCWLWTGAKNSDGYGHMRITREGQSRLVGAHQVSAALHDIQVPLGCEIDHLCKNRACVNPRHLEAVTHGKNVKRGDSRLYVGKAIKAASAKKRAQRECKRGHLFTKSNTRVAHGRRICRLCCRDWMRIRRAKAKRGTTKKRH